MVAEIANYTKKAEGINAVNILESQPITDLPVLQRRSS